MATTPTNLPVPSESPRDLKFNAGKIDEFVTSVAQKYIDRFGGEHYTIEGLRQIAQQAISAFGYITMDSFEDGNTLTLPNQVLRLEATGEYYRWDGAFPKVVPAGSTPDSTGGIGAGAWLSVGDAALRTMLASSSGAEMIGHGNTTVGAELDKLNNYLVTVNVKDYGAVGDWNETTQTGTDNTLAFQNAINALANMPDIRNGQVRQLYIPNGNYRIKNIIVPDTYGFMIEFKGDGFINTRLYCYPDSPATTPCIEINIEYVSFDSIEVLASLKRNASISDRSATLVEVKLPDGRADCDIKLMPTSSFGGAETLFRVYGRGFHCNGAVMFFSGTFLEIACDTRTWTTGGNQSTTGMRNYLINNNRFDTVGVMVKITGSGYQKDHINDLIISGNDIYQMDRLIFGADATLQHSIISSNSSVGSFAYNVIEIKRIVNTTISSNRWVKFYNRDSTPSVDSDYMHGMVSCSGSIEKVNIIGNSMSWNTLQVVSIGSASFSLNIVGNTFDQSYMSGTSAVIVRGANCEYLNISNNQFYNSIQPTLSVSAFGSSQTSPSVIYSGNLSSFLISGEYLSYPATLKYGATTVNTTGLRTKYTTVNRVVKASIQFGSSDTTSGGSGDEVSLSLPQNPVVDSGLTSLFSGGGSITFQSGGIPTIIRVLVSPSGGATFIKSDGTTMKRGDITSSFLLFFDVSYRI